MIRTGLLVVAACARAPAPTYPLHPSEPTAATGSIALLGEIQRPGRLAFHPGMHLTDAITEAGGLTVMAWTTRLTRIEHGVTQTYRINVRRIVDGHAPDPELAPGDVVLIDGRYL